MVVALLPVSLNFFIAAVRNCENAAPQKITEFADSSFPLSKVHLQEAPVSWRPQIQISIDIEQDLSYVVL